MKLIAVDKIAHFCAGWAIAATAFIFVGGWPAILLAAISGAAKELFDKVTGRGTPEIADFLFTLAGGIFAVSVCSLLPKVIPISSFNYFPYS